MTIQALPIYRATSIHPGIRPNRTFGQGRTCDALGCTTRLSVYNRSTSCSVHEEIRAYVVRGRRRPREEVRRLATGRAHTS